MKKNYIQVKNELEQKLFWHSDSHNIDEIKELINENVILMYVAVSVDKYLNFAIGVIELVVSLDLKRKLIRELAIKLVKCVVLYESERLFL